MPESFRCLAASAAAAAGYPCFEPDACLINLYEPGTRLSLHRDENERDLTAPIVSVSLGLPAMFLFGGNRRSDRPRRILLESGDIVVWGGPDRLVYHGVAPLDEGEDPADRQSPHQSDLSQGALSDATHIGLGCAIVLAAPSAIAQEPRTLKERLSDKASDAQRVDNCHVPPERRGTLPRPDCAEKPPPRSARSQSGSLTRLRLQCALRIDIAGIERRAAADVEPIAAAARRMHN